MSETDFPSTQSAAKNATCLFFIFPFFHRICFLLDFYKNQLSFHKSIFFLKIDLKKLNLVFKSFKGIILLSFKYLNADIKPS
jgi:hypothetical protein